MASRTDRPILRSPGLLAYRMLGWLAACGGIPYLILRRGNEWRERLGRTDSTDSGKRIWVHAASLGEFEAARPLIEHWSARWGGERILVSCTNVAARDRLREQLPLGARARLAPLDLWPIVGKVLDAQRPSALVFVETEIWPEWLTAAATRRIPVAVISARLSNKSYPRYRRLRSVIGPIVSGITVVGCRTARDRERWISIGVHRDRCEVWGNTKYDAGPAPATKPAIDSTDTFLLVGGSMRTGEEQILDLPKPNDAPPLRLLLAIRHLGKLPRWERACLARNLASGRASLLGLDLSRPDSLLAAELRRVDSPLPPVIFVDQMGLLQGLYRLGDAAFVGGTWVPLGGHNLFEPAREGIPVFFGKSTDGVRDASEELLRTGGGQSVEGADELLEGIERLRGDPERRRQMGGAAREAALALAGGVERTVAGLRRHSIPPEGP